MVLRFARSLHEIERFFERNPLASVAKILPLSKNLGFAGGNLEGLSHTRGEYVALLDNDTEPDERWLEELVEVMDKNPDVGICASKLIVYVADIIDSAGNEFS